MEGTTPKLAAPTPGMPRTMLAERPAFSFASWTEPLSAPMRLTLAPRPTPVPDWRPRTDPNWTALAVLRAGPARAVPTAVKLAEDGLPAPQGSDAALAIC